MEHTSRYLAYIIIEATTPLAIGSGEKGLLQDRLVQRDANDLPYIPGTSLAGVIRHELEDNANEKEKERLKKLFGFQNEAKSTEGKGSDVKTSSGYLIGKKHEVLEGIRHIDFTDEYYALFKKLPERDHVRITDKGAADAEAYGKFDEELVPKGARFVFSIELEANNNQEDEAYWRELLNILFKPTLRIGAGTRNGFGAFQIISCKEKILNLEETDDLKTYLNISSSLNTDTSQWQNYKPGSWPKHWKQYQIHLKPENFYIFGAGYGDKDADIIPKEETYIDWSEGYPKKTSEKILIPATSVKGAIAHRVAYHYNKIKENYIENNQSSRINIEFDPQEAIKNSLIEDYQKKITEIKEEISRINSANYEKLSIDELTSLKKKLQDKTGDLKEKERSIQELNEDVIQNLEAWNKYKDQIKTFSNLNKGTIPNTGTMNEAVRNLFGCAKNSEIGETGKRGNVIFSDVFLDKKKEDEKIFNHVAIDRYTGGGMHGALYTEKVAQTEHDFKCDIYLENSGGLDQAIIQAFEAAIKDLTTGKLQLGGHANKGHGVFTGSYKIINE